MDKNIAKAVADDSPSIKIRSLKLSIWDRPLIDVMAPGEAILAAYPPGHTPNDWYNFDKRSVNYSILSATSMSCLHVVGAAASVKSFHPSWWPAEIKSALVTTARSLKTSRKSSDDVFAYGSGQIDPVKAINPGLIYNTSTDNYVKLLCGLGYTTTIVRKMKGDHNTSCPAEKTHCDINYPSMATRWYSEKPFSVKFLIVVTNVGDGRSIQDNGQDKIEGGGSCYAHNSETALNERKSFVVEVSGKKIFGLHVVTATVEWSDGVNIVRSRLLCMEF